MRYAAAINVYESLQDTLEMATIFDKGGLDQVWIVDFPAPRFAPTVALKVASITNLRIGIGLISSQIYDLDHVVRWLETLVEEFGPRFDLLIGPGDRSSLARIGQKKWIAKQIMEHTINVGIKIKEKTTKLNLGSSILLGAQGPQMIRESRNLDGVLLNVSDPKMVKWAADIMKPIDDSFQFGVFAPTEVVSHSNETSSAEFNYSSAIVALGAPKALLQEFGLEDIIAKARSVRANNGKLSQEVLNTIGLDIIHRWGFFTTPEKIEGSLAALSAHGVNSIVFGPPLSHNKVSASLLIKGIHKR